MCYVKGIIRKDNSSNEEDDFLKQNLLSHAHFITEDLNISFDQCKYAETERFFLLLKGVVYNLDHLKRISKYNGDSEIGLFRFFLESKGLEPLLSEMDGAYALIVYDKKEKELKIAVEAMARELIYYKLEDGKFLFSSTLKDFNLAEIDRQSLKLYLQFGHVPSPYTICKNVKKVEAGTILLFKAQTGILIEKDFWNPATIYQKELLHFESSTQAVEHLHQSILDAVSLHTQTQFSKGAFLSGGVDSSTVAAIMQSQSNVMIDTFSIGFQDPAFDETPYAQDVAKAIHSKHHVWKVGDKELLEIVPQINDIYPEPFADSSQIPTFLAGQLAKKHVNLVLSGDGGDELFGGYWRYHFANYLWKNMQRLPLKLRRPLFRILAKLPYPILQAILAPLSLRKSNYGKKVNYPDQFLKLMHLLQMNTKEELYYKGLMTESKNAELLINENNLVNTKYDQYQHSDQAYFDYMMLMDIITYLRDSNVVKSLWVAKKLDLDIRSPLMNLKIVNFAMNLPLKYKINEHSDKWILRQVLYQYIPEELMNRPKKGFEVPISDWLKTSLKDWATELINEKTIREQGFFHADVLKKMWSEHQNGKRNWSAFLWKVVVFQDWLMKQK